MSKKTLESAKEADNEVIVQVKENQPTLLEDCRKIAEQKVPDDAYQEPLTKIRNRIERRKVEVFEQTTFTRPENWGLVEAVVKVKRARDVFDTKTKSWKNSDEVSYYISTTLLSAQAFSTAIRDHWGIENRNHYVKDVTFGEDKSRIRKNPHIFAKLRSFALNILRVNKVQNIHEARYKNSLNLNKVLKLKGILEN